MADTQLTYRIALSLLPGMDAGMAALFTDACGSEQGVIEATEAELKGVPGAGKSIVSAQRRFQALEQAREEAEYLAGVKIEPIWYADSDFPPMLREQKSAPAMLYAAGSTELAGRPVVSIVGTRHATPYGIAFTERLVAELAAAIPDVVIVSGLAYGIDVAAHRAALASGVATVGVVAHGLSTIYPAQHRDIASRMVAAGGALFSEYTHRVAPLRPQFLARNRIIALMADAVVVIESGERGGALSTVRYARLAGRRVFALPGRVTDLYSLGCNKLIADGSASMLSSPADLISALGYSAKAAESDASEESAEELMAKFSDVERSILSAIAANPEADNDTITAVTGLPPHVLMATMIGLEMKGAVTAVAGNRYQMLIPF